MGKNLAVSTPRRSVIKAWADGLAADRDAWIARNIYYYESDRRYMRFLVPPGSRVLEIGSGTGQLLDSLKPSYGVGVDFSERMVETARLRYPHLHFKTMDIEADEVLSVGSAFDFVVLSDTIGLLDDIDRVLVTLQGVCSAHTRLVIAFHSHIWEPLLKLGSAFGRRMPHPPMNYLSDSDFGNLLNLAGFEEVRWERRSLLPVRVLGLEKLINNYIAPLPIINRFCLRTYIVARSTAVAEGARRASVSIVVPCRNERGNIASVVERMPPMDRDVEIIFVEGGSKDGTYEECLRVAERYGATCSITVVKQTGKGKGDAVRLGFSIAKGEILVILDADLTVAPEELPKFIRAIDERKGEFINGTRLVYPKEDRSMPLLNYFANRFFALTFGYLLGQRFSDTLCGTKVLNRVQYEKIAADRAYFGDFDPYGDFDLLLGASKQNLKIVEIPIHYAARTYGESQISQSRFTGGVVLLRMAFVAFKKLKVVAS